MSSGARRSKRLNNRTPLRISAVGNGSGDSSNSTVSGLTTPNSRLSQNNEGVLHDASAGLLQLGEAEVPSPQRPFEPDPLQQEEAIERRLYRDAPGNGDSEDEMEPDDVSLDAQIDELTHEFDERAAVVFRE